MTARKIGKAAQEERARYIAELEAIEARLKAIALEKSGWCPHKPYPKQRQFVELTTAEALYGGAAGGGKTDALLMDALKDVNEKKFSALILRRTLGELEQADGLIPRSHEWLDGSRAEWNGTKRVWTFPSGATIQFGYLDTDADRFRYAGGAYQSIGWDELTQMPEQWYRFLFSRLRRLAGSKVVPRMRATSNPGGIGHQWVFRRFVAKEYAERPFIPAKLDDNPALDAAEYKTKLALLDATTRAQLEEGVWIRDAAGLVYSYNDAENGIDLLPGGGDESPITNFLLGIDFGVRDATAFVVLGWREHDPFVYVVEASKKKGMIPSEAAAEVGRLEAKYRFVRIVGDVGGLGKAFAEEMRRRYTLPVEPAQKQNKQGYISLFNGDLQRGRIKVLRSTCAPLIDEWSELPWTEDARGVRKEAAGFDDHCSDACLYAWRAASAFNETPLVKVKKLTPEEREARVRQMANAQVQEWERADEEEFERSLTKDEDWDL